MGRNFLSVDLNSDSILGEKLTCWDGQGDLDFCGCGFLAKPWASHSLTAARELLFYPREGEKGLEWVLRMELESTWGPGGEQVSPPPDVHVLILRPVNVLSFMARGTLQMWLNQGPRDGESVLDCSTWPNQNMDSVQLSSVTQSCPTLCSPMDCSAPGLPVHHQLPEFTQTHVRWVSDVIPTISSSVVPFSSCLPSTFSNCAQRRRDYSRRLVTEMQHHWLQRWSKRTTSRGKWAPLGPETDEETKVLPWSLQTGTSPANTLTLDLYFAELCNNIFLWS